jgi:uncharacterized protein
MCFGAPFPVKHCYSGEVHGRDRVAGTSLLALLDDITTALDDIALLTKLTAKKTAGVLGDDLALNAQQVSGVNADRELPVVWAVAKGSALNKLILVPVAIGISAIAPWLVTPLLMIGGAYLCFEGSEKLLHKFLHSPDEDVALHAALADPNVDLVALEKEKIKGAIRTDFVLSAEIVAIALGAVADATFGVRLSVLAGISALMTVGVYGLVAGIVKLDDLGMYLTRKPGGGAVSHALGRLLLQATPYLMRTLSIAGTVAMFLVGGGILTHGIPPVHHAIEGLAEHAGAAGAVVPALANGVIGVVAGALLVGAWTLVNKLRGKPAH